MEKLLLVVLSLVSVSASAASLNCEQKIENVVGATSKYVETRNTSNDAVIVGSAQDALFKAIADAKESCK